LNLIDGINGINYLIKMMMIKMIKLIETIEVPLYLLCIAGYSYANSGNTAWPIFFVIMSLFRLWTNVVATK
jgi:hypothetical protein